VAVDLTAVDFATLGNIKAEVGRATMSNSTVEIPTMLKMVLAVHVTPCSTITNADGLYVNETLPLEGATAITVTNIRASQATKFSYVAIGY
jgi:hypothetical protein